ncbi:MAG: protein kinase [Polyangiaceae bacterium]
MRPQVGQVIHNKYRLLRLIGDGGMGSVFEARHEVLGTTVALKFLHPELSKRSGLVQRFLQEARVSAQIQSPHVVRVTDVDQNPNGQAFIVMEYLEGKTLQTLYEELYHARQRLSYGDALEYSMQMLEGVEAAHVAGVVHRDLKPDNVIITRGKKGEPLLKLLDFGIAKLKVTGQLDRGLTRPGIIMGTPEYMAPEQAYSADAVDARADIFSLGVMIFEMLAGRRPVGGDEPHQIATAYLTRNIAKLLDLAPHVPAELAAAVHRAMGPKPEDRFSSVGELRAAIEPFWLATRPAATPTPAGVSMLTPAPAAGTPNNVAGSLVDGVRRVPKTLPPEGDPQPAPVINAPSGGQSVEVVFSSNPAPDARPSGEVVSSAPATTPVSKMPVFDQVGSTPQPAESPAVSLADKGDQPLEGAAAFARTDAALAESVAVALAASQAQALAPNQAALGASTSLAAPLAGALDLNAMGTAPTVEAPPLSLGGGANKGATAAMPMMPERAGGTAVGAPVFQGGVPGGNVQSPYGGAAMAGMPSTASMDPLPVQNYAATAPRRPVARSTGTSFALILLAAAAVAGVVVGGVYFAQQHAREQDRADDTPLVPTAPPVVVTSENPTSSTPVRVPTAQPPVTNRPPQLPKPTGTGTASVPTAIPSGTPTALPTTFPTALPTTFPTSLIPIPLPTAFPFPFPQQQQQPPQPAPSTTPGKGPIFVPKPQPSATTTSTSTRPHIIITFPKNQD